MGQDKGEKTIDRENNKQKEAKEEMTSERKRTERWGKDKGEKTIDRKKNKLKEAKEEAIN